MKLVTILSFLIMSCAHLPSPPTTEMLDGANKIIIITNLSKKDAYQNALQILLSMNIPIKNKDENNYFINTDQVSVAVQIAEFSVFIRDIDKTISNEGVSQIEITGNLYVQLWGTRAASKTKNSGMDGSPLQVSWGKMVTFAKRVPDGKVFYERTEDP